jgi:hypothetical protein
MAFYKLSFVDEGQIGRDLPADVLIVPGGDTFRLAETLGSARLSGLERWIAGGGKYVGICAGAYLPLSSSLPPLDRFNLVKSRIRNLSRNLPKSLTMEKKFSVPYGCFYVFHPVRGPVVLDFGGVSLIAPLYGGPMWEECGEGECLAIYTSFTEKTLFLTEESVAGETMIGRPAALRKEHGEGVLYLFGPHFEHPDHHASNAVIGSVLLNPMDHSFGNGKDAIGSDEHEPKCAVRPRDLRETVSNARIMYGGLEGANWRIGQKTWDHEKIGYFINAIWERVVRAEETDMVLDLPAEVLDGLSRCVARMKAIRLDMRSVIDTTSEAELLFRDLAETSSLFFDRYFAAMRAAAGN